MADNAEPFAKAVAQALGRAIGVPVEFVVDHPWPQREQMLYDGEVHVAWLCGLPYVREADRCDPRIELLAAPVMRPARYGAQPVYFTDVMVRRDHRAQTLADLRGASVAINEPNSHSDYHVLRHALAGQGLPAGFFPRGDRVRRPPAVARADRIRRGRRRPHRHHRVRDRSAPPARTGDPAARGRHARSEPDAALGRFDPARARAAPRGCATPCSRWVPTPRPVRRSRRPKCRASRRSTMTGMGQFGRCPARPRAIRCR